MGKLHKIINKVKSTFELSYEQLKAKPHVIEPDDQSVAFLNSEVLDQTIFSQDMARKAAEKYLKTKFFPPALRVNLWLALIKNNAHINTKLYDCYKEIIQKKLADNPNFGV